MPVATQFPSGGQFAILSITDPYTIEEWRTAARALLESEFCREHRRLLVDRRHAAAPTTAFVETMTHFFGAQRSELSGKHAAVLVADDAAFGMSRMTELLSQLKSPEMIIRTFRDYDTAVQWLMNMRKLSIKESDPSRVGSIGGAFDDQACVFEPEARWVPLAGRCLREPLRACLPPRNVSEP